ncbi:MAG: hypothetical protein J6T19_04125, partial [Paludibacteraceae bacterium]|nr:hypothetical protein [Paludibacteraceae bacterium]
SVNPYGILSQNGTICFAVYIFLAKDFFINEVNSTIKASQSSTNLVKFLAKWHDLLRRVHFSRFLFAHVKKKQYLCRLK